MCSDLALGKQALHSTGASASFSCAMACTMRNTFKAYEPKLQRMAFHCFQVQSVQQLLFVKSSGSLDFSNTDFGPLSCTATNDGTN